LFFRAKHSLKNQLERHGFERDHLLAALTMFAGLTLRNGKKAAAGEVVLASSLETGLGISNRGRVNGIEFYSVRARIQREAVSQP